MDKQESHQNIQLHAVCMLCDLHSSICRNKTCSSYPVQISRTSHLPRPPPYPRQGNRRCSRVGVHGEDSVSQMLHHSCDGETSGISLPGPFPLTQDFFLDGRSWCGAGETRGCQVAERKVKQVESMFLSMSYLFWWLLSLVTESAGCCK